MSPRRARAASVLALRVGPQVGDEAAPEFPDFAFSTDGQQQTLGEVLEKAPVLLVLYEPPAPTARLAALAGLRPRLNLVAVSLVDVAADVGSVLALFHAPGDDGETEFLLDRSFRVRARWTARDLADVVTLVADGERIAHSEVSAAGHVGHAH